MGFFASRPRRAAVEPDEAPREEPEWFGPPRGVLPGYVPTRAVVFRTDEAILFVGRFDVYRTGVELTVELQLRTQDEALWDVPWELRHGRSRGDELSDDFLRLGVVYADGSSWSNVDAVFPSDDQPPASPFLMSRGGGGGGNSYAMNQWLWPLPPEGPLTFVAEWPRFAVPESTASVDAGELRRAAELAQDLWPT